MKNEKKGICLLCGSTAELKHNGYPGYQEHDIFEIYYCLSCNTTFSIPRIEADAIYENIYKNKNKVPGYDRYWKYLQNIKKVANPLEYLANMEDVYWGVREAITLSVKDKKTTKILEIGSGLGYLTYSLIKANYDATGLDISQTAVKQANEIFGDHFICADLYEYAQFHGESFDIVILAEVIEHIDKPLDFIKSIIKLLKPSGKAIITTPNKSFFSKDILWASDMPPIHCWWFSEESMRHIAKIIDFDINFINFSDYYKKNYHAVDMRSLKYKQLPIPVFNQNGELIINATKTNNALNSYLQLLVAKIPYTKKLYRKVKELLNSEITVCGNRGIVLCAIIQKSKE